MSRSRLKTSLIAITLLGAGFASGLACRPVLPATTCIGHDDCPDGYRCEEKHRVCVAGESADGGSPDRWAERDAGFGVDAAPVEFPDDWWDTRWPQRMRLRFANSSVENTGLQDFVVPVILDLRNFDYDTALPDGSDLRFVSSSGDPLLQEVEQWRPEDRSVIWVRVPSIQADSAADAIYLYWGNPVPTMSPVATPYTDDYALALHMRSEFGSPGLRDSSPQHHPVLVEGQLQLEQTDLHGQALRTGQGLRLSVPQLDRENFPQENGTFSVILRADNWSAFPGALLDVEDPNRPHFSFSVSGTYAHAWAEAVTAPNENIAAESLSFANGWESISFVWQVETDAVELTVYRHRTDEWSTAYLPVTWRPSQQLLWLVDGIAGPPFRGVVDDIRLERVPRSTRFLRSRLRADANTLIVYEPEPVAPDPEHFGRRDWVPGAVVEYEFEEAGGTLVRDSSGVGAPLNLEIAEPSDVRWIAGGLVIERPTVIASTDFGDKIMQACQDEGSVTVEAWIQPDSDLMYGPSRIVSFAYSHLSANFMLGQALERDDRGSARYMLRFNTSETYDTGKPRWTQDNPARTLSPPGRARTQVVFTRDGVGEQVCAYVNGRPEGCTPWPGSVGRWSTKLLRLGNEGESERPWLGTYYRVAIYGRALSDAEVLHNYSVGSAR